MDRPITTLFMIQSLDGKISTGDTDVMDVDTDFPRINGVKEGLHQYYDIEKTTGAFSLNTGRVMEKIGVNTRTIMHPKVDVNFIIIDNKPHLNEKGIGYLSNWVNTLYLVTTNKHHPAYALTGKFPNIVIVEFADKINLADLLRRMKKKYGTQKITIQSGGTLNAAWLRAGLIDYVSVVIAPCLIGGHETQSLIGGESIHSVEDLKKIRALELIQCEVLENSYIHVQYKVINESI
jgi:2,5-diamino-6-(ribosylamino)-4(3H)-pyrimidinone 5'-phosphate reductase